jgi:hypothetical protein
MGGSDENCVPLSSTEIVAARRRFAERQNEKSTRARRLREPVSESADRVHSCVVRVDE